MAAGLGAALSQSCSYIFSRRYMARSGRGALPLLALSHLQIGGLAGILLLALWPQPPGGWGSVILPVMGTSGFYLAGQVCFLMALRVAPASSLSPLLGMKILPLIAIGFLLSGPLHPAHYGAVALVVAAALCLAQRQGPLSARAWLGLLGAVCCYALSDQSIPYLIRAMSTEPGLLASVQAGAVCYSLCGLISLPALLAQGAWPSAREWRLAWPFALSWYLSMVSFFAAIATVGVVLAVIFQSFRAIFSVVLGVVIAHWGHVHIEERLGVKARLRQISAAVLMCLAIALYISCK